MLTLSSPAWLPQLVAVYEVLRDSGRREMYNKFLVDGMPDWRSALYYYRRARKMGMLEIMVILSIITTVGQYLTAWAGYKEKRFTVVRVACQTNGCCKWLEAERWVSENVTIVHDFAMSMNDQRSMQYLGGAGS